MTRQDIAATGIVLAALVGLLVIPPAYGFVGWDTYPILAAARIDSWADLRGIFADCLTESYFPFGFYRPLYSLSMALDYAVWGLAPLGFRFTNAVLFGAAALVLYRFTRALLGPGTRAGPLVSLIIMLVFPLHVSLAAGPFSHRSDLLCGLLVVLALHTELRRVNASGRWRHLLPACVTLLAQASKEAGIVVPPLVLLLVLVTDRHAGGVRLRRVLAAATWHTGAVAVVVGARMLVLGGLAGHISTSVTAVPERLPAVLGRVVLALVAQRPAFGPPTAADFAAAGAFLVLLAALAVACMRAEHDSAGARLRAALVGASMTLASAGVFALVGWVTPWYLFLPSMGLALVGGAATEAALATIRARPASRHRPVVWTLLVGLAGWVLWQASASPFIRRDPIWAEWTKTQDAFLATLQARLEVTPAGGVITIAYPGRVLRPYSVQAWADLVRGRGAVEVVTEAPTSRAPGPETTVVLVARPVRARPRARPGVGHGPGAGSIEPDAGGRDRRHLGSRRRGQRRRSVGWS